MKSLIALENLVEEEEEARVKFARHQLSEHEAGTAKLTPLIKVSTETKLEETEELLQKHQEMLSQLLLQDRKELEKEEKLREAVLRKNYYNFQKTRLKRQKHISSDLKIEAMLIIDEITPEVQFEDHKILEIAVKTMELNLTTHEEIATQLTKITQEFTKLISSSTDKEIDSISMLNAHIPIIILQFSILISNITEYIEEKQLPEFHGLPNFEDWWIEELWSSHQAYFALYKWKSIISNLCITEDQRKAWEIIFSNWIFIKKIINQKGVLGFNYNMAVDKLLSKYTGLEEELSTLNLVSMESIIKSMTKKEDFNTFSQEHKIVTPYLKYKRDALEYQEDK